MQVASLIPFYRQETRFREVQYFAQGHTDRRPGTKSVSTGGQLVVGPVWFPLDKLLSGKGSSLALPLLGLRAQGTGMVSANPSHDFRENRMTDWLPEIPQKVGAAYF